MRMLHNAADLSELQRRLELLRADSERRWGAMSVDQMLWHINAALATFLGEHPSPPEKPPLPPSMVKFIVLYLPWPKGGPTMSTLVAKQHYDFDAERARCRQLLDAFTKKRLDEPWPLHPAFGRISGKDASRIQAKHLDHHLKQFGV